MEHDNIKLIELKEQIEQAIRRHVPHMSVPQGTTQDDVYLSIRDIMRDNPDIFWFSHQWKYTENDLTLRFQYTISKERSITAKRQIEDVIQNDFLINDVSSLTTLEQIMYVYKWMALYCKYNIYSAYNQTIYSVFVCRNSVCTGYAKAAQYLFKILGIESKLVFGTMHNAEKGSRHCWLLVKINNQWYHHDPTFAVPEISDLVIKAGVTPIYGAEGLVYNYFCCDTESIKHSRIIEDESELPICKSQVDFKSLQKISIHLHRTEETEQLGVKGCLLSDNGIFSDVYLWHSEKNVQSVVKIYRDDSSHAFLLHELSIMRQLASSNNVLHVLGVTDNQDGLIIEQATPLADLLCSHYYQLSAMDFCKLLLDVMAGLQDCIRLGVYYRDIHLNNIYRTPEGHYVLGDFGSCVWIDNDKTSHPTGVGSPWYMAPETYFNGSFNEESAIYGIGMLAYFMLNDFLPPLWNEYGDRSLKLRLYRMELPRPILLKKPSCAFEQQMDTVIEKSLSFFDRYQNLFEFEKAIKRCALWVENDDYLLIDGGSSERMLKFDSKETTDENDYNRHTDFHSTCTPDIIVSNGKNENKAGKIRCPRDKIEENTSTTPCESPHVGKQGCLKPNHILSLFKKIKLLSFFRRKRSIETILQNVYSSIFAPAEVKRNTHMLVQIYLHLYEETENIKALAEESDKSAERRDYIPLQCKLKKGDKVDVQLNIYGDTLLMSDKKNIVWQGSFTKRSFDYFVPKDIDVDELSCVTLLSVNGIPVGEMRFITRIVEQPRLLNPEVIAHKYNKVFISYAHKDEAKVKSFHEGLKLAGIEHFFDRAYLKTGDVFPQIIQDYIDTSDLFVLFWSENASKSDYVQKERKQALERAYPQVKPQKAAKLSIYPMSIEPRAELPVDMKDNYHFGEL